MALPAEIDSLLLTRTATVYGRSGAGSHTVVLKTGLKCALQHLRLQPAPSGAARSELAARRKFVWEASYHLPANTQVEVEGLRWQPVNTNAISTRRWIDGTDAFKFVDVVRAGVT